MRNALLVVLVAFMVSGCYRAQVNTGLQASTNVVTNWEHYFIHGLVQPSTFDATAMCNGRNAASVETQHTFVQGLVGALTLGIYTPITVTVVCSS